MKREKLFVYGALKDPMIQKDIFGRVVKREESWLCGCTTTTVSIEHVRKPAFDNEAVDFSGETKEWTTKRIGNTLSRNSESQSKIHCRSQNGVFGHALDGEIYPIAESGEANSCIDGLILELTQKELQCADAYEGDVYKRVSVSIDNEPVWVYAK